MSFCFWTLLLVHLFATGTRCYNAENIFRSYIMGNRTFLRGTSVNLSCHLNPAIKNMSISGFTFFEVNDQKCSEPKRDLTNFTNLAGQDLLLRLPLEPDFVGRKKFACISKKRVAHFGCHTVNIGEKPALPNVTCVFHELSNLRCRTHPNLMELQRSTGLTPSVQEFSSSYSLGINDRIRINCPFGQHDGKNPDDCLVDGKGDLRYTVHVLVNYVKVHIVLKNQLGGVEKTFIFSSCQIEQAIIKKLNVEDVGRSSARLTWSLEQSPLPIDSEYFTSEIICTSSHQSPLQRTSKYFAVNLSKLMPFALYTCKVRTRTTMTTEANEICLGIWSSFAEIVFRTPPSAPSRGPPIFPGMTKRFGESCELFFLEIPKIARNGIVTEYRVENAISNATVSTKYLNVNFSCPRERKLEGMKLKIEARTENGGWSPPSEVGFFPVDLNRSDGVELELWSAHDQHVKPIINVLPGREVLSAFLVVCNCSTTCSSPRIRCIGMRRILPSKDRTASLSFDDFILNPKEERVMAYVSFQQAPHFDMSAWVSCSYDNRTRKPFLYNRKPTLKMRSESVLVSFERQDLACSDSVRLPVRNVFLRLTCHGKQEQSLKVERKGSVSLVIPVPFNLTEKSSGICTINMSFDDNDYVQIYEFSLPSRDENSFRAVVKGMVIVSIIIFIVLSVAVCVKCFPKIRDTFHTVFSIPSLKEPNITKQWSPSSPNSHLEYQSIEMSEQAITESTTVTLTNTNGILNNPGNDCYVAQEVI